MESKEAKGEKIYAKRYIAHLSVPPNAAALILFTAPVQFPRQRLFYCFPAGRLFVPGAGLAQAGLGIELAGRADGPCGAARLLQGNMESISMLHPF